MQSFCNGQISQPDKIHQFAKDIEYIEIMDMFSYRQVRLSGESQRPFTEFLEYAYSLSIDEIEEFLNSKNPKIRALGLLSLSQLDSQPAMLRYADFLSDSTFCFKGSPFIRNLSIARFKDNTLSISEDDLYEAKNLSVSDIAKEILQHYFHLSGHVYFDKELETFIQERKNLEYTAGFLKLLKIKETGGIGSSRKEGDPFVKERQPFIDELKKKINSIQNDVDKSIYKIYLSADGYKLFNQEEMVIELQFLGKERVKEILMRQPPTTDPDLLNIQNGKLSNLEYNRMCKWILLNAEKFFDEEDVSFLLKRGAHEYENEGYWLRNTMAFPFWYIAASRLDKTNASNHLKTCLKLLDKDHEEFERAEVYAELWHQQGLNEVEFILDWIFNSYKLNEKGRERIDQFIHYLEQDEDIVLLKRIIADKRFENSINVWYVVEIATQINKLKSDEIVDNNLIAEIWHPMGLDRVEWWRDRALKEYPDETKKMLEKIKTLKEILRKVE